MGRKSIPSWRRANFPNTTRFSRRSKRSCDGGCCGCCGFGWLKRIAEETPKLEPRTLYFERRMRQGIAIPIFRVQGSMFDVRCSRLFSCVPRRVMGAWWPSRSSKPLSARFTSRGMFDSYPLRHFKPFLDLTLGRPARIPHDATVDLEIC